MRKGLFCPGCGSVEGPFFKGLCEKCFIVQNKMLALPKEIKIERCKFCGRIKIFDRWRDQDKGLIESFVRKKAKLKLLSNPKIEIALEPVGEKTLATVKATGTLDGPVLTAEAKSFLVPLKSQCYDCAKLGSDYYEATIQLRFDHKPSKGEKDLLLEEITKIVEGMKKGNVLASIVGISDAKNGFDVVLASNKAAQKVVRVLSEKTKNRVKKSFQLAGLFRDGKEKHRFTYCLRF